MIHFADLATHPYFVINGTRRIISLEGKRYLWVWLFKKAKIAFSAGVAAAGRSQLHGTGDIFVEIHI